MARSLLNWKKNTNNKKRQTVPGACNLTKLHFTILIYLFLISSNVWAIIPLRDHQQINFVTLNRFCPLSKRLPPPPLPPHAPVLNGQNQARWNPKQKQMKTKCPFVHCSTKVLKGLLIKDCKIQIIYQFFYFLLFYIASEVTSADIIFTTFQNLIQHLCTEKRFSLQIFIL